MDEAQLLETLRAHSIEFERIDHPPVFTCAEAAHLRPDFSGVSTKNLFMRDEKEQRFFLLMTDCNRRIDMRALGEQVSARKLHLGAEDRLIELLGVTRGSVTVLGLINDSQRQVELLVDREIWAEENFLCHPLVNTATLRLTRAGLERFFALTGHEPVLVTC